MSGRSKFVLIIVAMLVAVIIIEYRMPRRFEWNPTFAHDDSQPFGCMLFDSIMSETMPCGYTVEHKTVWQMERDSTLTEPHGLLILSDDALSLGELERFLSLVDEGHVVLVGTTVSLYEWADTLGLTFHWVNNFAIRNLAGKNPEKTTIEWTAEDSGYPHDSVIRVYEQMISRTMELPPDSLCVDSLPIVSLAEWHDGAEGNDDGPIAISLSRGKGELIILSAPLLMTNYAMLNHDNGAVLIHRLMNRMSHLPVIRTESYVEKTAMVEQSPFYVFLQHPPLRWAVYLTIMGVVLFCIFTARRRQRPIPVIEQPKNGNLEFVRLIGTLYWQEGNHQGLLQKKLAYTAEEIRRQTGLDIMDAEAEQETIEQLARLTGMEADNLRYVLHNVKRAVDPANVITEPELKIFIASLDEIVQNL